MNTTLQRWLAGAGWAALGLSAHATSITSVSPQGEVARVRQIVVKFDAAVVPMGDLRAAAPVKLDCDNKQAQSQGTGRWTGPREWVFDLADDLPPGVRCTVEKVANLKDVAGEPVKGAAQYRFATGGPSVTRVVPSSYQPLDSRQFFGLQFNADVVLPGLEDMPYYGIYAAAGTPPEMVQAVSQAVAKAVAAPDVHEQLVGMGLSVGYMTPEQLLARERAYSAVWARIIRDSGFQPQ